jgi:hypothetical protein
MDSETEEPMPPESGIQMCLPYMFFFEAAIDYYHDRWNPTEYLTKNLDLRKQGGPDRY